MMLGVLDPYSLPPGRERRERLREQQIKITTDDFSEAEWVEIRAEARGTRGPDGRGVPSRGHLR